MEKILFKFILPFFLITSCSGLKKMEKKLQGNWILTSINNQSIEQIKIPLRSNLKPNKR